MIQLRTYMYLFFLRFSSFLSSVSCCVVSDSLWPHGLQHSRLPCPSLTPGACLDWSPLSWWCHPTILSFLSPSPPSFNLFQHQGFFPVSQFFTSGGQSIRASASGSVLPMNQFSSVALSSSNLCNPWQHARLPCLSPAPRVCSNSYPLSQRFHPTIWSLLQLPSVFPSIRVFFQWVSSSCQLVKVLEFQLQHQSFQWIFRADFL